MMTRISSRTFNIGPRRNHVRLLVVALAMSLIVVAMFSTPRTESAANVAPFAVSEGPDDLVVTATTNSSISLDWSSVSGATQYRVERSESLSGQYAFVANAGTSNFTDNTVTSQRAYLYRVRAIAPDDSCPSGPSNSALGTAISFEFSSLFGKQIRAQHVHDVRTATNAVRTLANLSAASWTRPTLNNLEVKASDILEVRSRLVEALTALEVDFAGFQDPLLIPGGQIRAIHVEDLQTVSTRGVRENPNPVIISSNKAEVGEFQSVTSLPLVPVHLSVLPDGRILFWGRDKNINSSGNVREVIGKSEAYVWDMDHGSNKTDVAVYRPSDNKWYLTRSSDGHFDIIGWGISGDIPVPGDYDGDGRADVAIFRPSNGLWGILNSSDGSITALGLGMQGDTPVPADYDQDGKTDIAIFRSSTGFWGIRNSGDGTEVGIVFGANGDVPVPGDYDLDRKADLAVFRPSQNNWLIRKSSNTSQQLTKQWGTNGDVPAPGDYNGDGATDLAVYRVSDGNYHVRNIRSVPESSESFFVGQDSSAVARPGDYDGDGRTDGAIYLPSGLWHIRNSSTQAVQIRSWGTTGDLPVPKDYDGMRRVAHTTTNLFCSGHSFLSDGRLLVSGGHQAETDGFGSPHVNFFDFRNNTWTRGTDMNAGRWYPYNVTLNNGETLILSGLITPSTMNNTPQIYGSCPRSLDPPGLEFSTYPFMHLTPAGKVLVVQSGQNDKDSRLLRPFDYDVGENPQDPNAKPGVWENFASTNYDHWTGSSVLFDSGRKALVLGGFDSGQNPTRHVEFVDLMQSPGMWKNIEPMNFPRTYHTTTILPDGKVLVSGGVKCQGSIDVTCGPVLRAEMWDPAASSCPTQVPWRIMAQQNEIRAYHSIAALLPDGRVLVGGGGLPGAVGEIDLNGDDILSVQHNNARLFGHKNVEFYSPPYLFNANGTPAARPFINSAPTDILYGQPFNVGVSGAGSAPKVSLVRLASVTHGFNQDQRHLFLTASVSGSTLTVTPPANSNICPPGYYMLFVLNNGVPSVAKIVKVGAISVFPTEVPVTTGSGEGSTWEQGFEFQSSVPGEITHIRFWKAPGEQSGNHVGRIWHVGTQQLVASVNFECETASGWQEAKLATPLQIQPGQDYRVTYNIHTVVAKTFNVIVNTPRIRGPLTVWGSIYGSPAGSYPTTLTSSNLFVDIVFKTGQ